MKYWKKRPRVMIDQTRSPRPATIRTIPAANGQTRPPGHGRPPWRPSTSASTTQRAMAGSKMKALRTTAPRAPAGKTRATPTPPVHHPAAASGVAAQPPGREPGGPRRRRPGRDREQGYSDLTVTDPATRDAAVARSMWTLFEPVHAVTYFAPEARAATEDAGLRGFW